MSYWLWSGVAPHRVGAEAMGTYNQKTTKMITPGQLVSNYRVVRELGEDDMGVVFEGVHNSSGRSAAIKILHPEFSRNPEPAVSFLSQAMTDANSVQHPGIVNIVAVGCLPDGRVYIVTDYVAGDSLTQWLAERGGRLKANNALPLARQLAEALTAAHSQGVIHRDLNPDNIMIVADPNGSSRQQAKILDFGVAMVAESQGLDPAQGVTPRGVLRGTPLYKAPEQCKGASKAMGKADVYSLGAILYQMLAGQPPFIANSSAQVVALHSLAAPRPIRELNPQIPDDVAVLLHQMLAKAPDERPSMRHVAGELGRMTGNPRESLRDAVASIRLEDFVASPASPASPASSWSPAEPPSSPSPCMAAPISVPAAPMARPSSVTPGSAMAPQLPPRPKLRDLVADAIGIGRSPEPPEPEAALARLDVGCFGVDAPRRMTIDAAAVVTASAVRDRLLRSLMVASAQHEAPQLADTPLGRILRVELIPDSPTEFTVTPLSEAEQPVLRTELTQWQWLVTPRQAGPNKRLRVRATNIVDVGGKQLTKSHPVRTLAVDVAVAAEVAGPGDEVSTVTVRRLLDAVLPSDATLEAFCLDYFPQVLLRFGGGMERMQKVTLLLSAVPPRQVLARLREAEPELLEQLARLQPPPPAPPAEPAAGPPPAPPDPTPAASELANTPPFVSARSLLAAREPELPAVAPAPVVLPAAGIQDSAGRRWAWRLLCALLMLLIGAGSYRCVDIHRFKARAERS